MPENALTRKEGLVLEALPGDLFKVRFEDGAEALGYLSGRMRMNHIRVLPGDKVDVEFSPYDPKRGRIVRRN
ncbi:MAG: translation initiation factor IF-1 [bacterium]|nr:translation initiation factor IF-1 [bacterium]